MMDTTAFFVVGIMSYFMYARWYYEWNMQRDRCQLPILIVAAIVGLVSALCLNLGPFISVFCVAPKVTLCGIFLSDILHLVLQGPWRDEDKNEKVGDVEDGLQNARMNQLPRNEEKLPVI